METYDTPCCQCGLCCITEVCPIGMRFLPIKNKNQKCPALKFEGDLAECTLYTNKKEVCPPALLSSLDKVFGIGAGCCIKAQAFKDGASHDFASLPVFAKQKIVRSLR